MAELPMDEDLYLDAFGARAMYEGAAMTDITPILSALDTQAEEMSPSAVEELLDTLDVQRAMPVEEVPVPCAFLTGVAGTGKTKLIRDLIDEDDSFGVLSATTGIAAVNLGVGTINSLLRYFDTESLEDQYVTGRLAANLHRIAHEVENLVIDEVSMMAAPQLDLIFKAASEVNDYASMRERRRRLGIILTGDFCQLPPVKAPFAFEATNWSWFAQHVIRLQKVWRQTDPKFLEAMKALRAGDGLAAADVLRDIVQWRAAVDRDFDGTTIVAKNDEVTRHNFLSLAKIQKPIIRIPSKAWGTLANFESGARHKGEWKNIPEVLEIKEGAYVMILKNSGPNLEYANGDCGHVMGIDQQNKAVLVKLERTGETVSIGILHRKVHVKDQPDTEVYDPSKGAWDGKLPYYDEKPKRWAIGGLQYVPLRLAYATTVHKCQGLTLDKVQIDSRAHFFGEAGMAYVAMSRARDPKNTFVVGTHKLFATKVKIDEKVREWL